LASELFKLTANAFYKGISSINAMSELRETQVADVNEVAKQRNGQQGPKFFKKASG
jgi:UDP-glucose 6-dehydrogenase